MGIQLVFLLAIHIKRGPFFCGEDTYNEGSKVFSGCAGVSKFHYCSMVQIAPITPYLLNKRWWIVIPQEGGVFTY